MRSNNFKLLALIMALMLTFSIAGVAAADEADKPDELTVFLRERWAGYDFDNLVINEVQKRTNTKWNIIIGAQSSFMDQLNILFATQDIPDIMNMSANDAVLASLVEDGVLLPINQYFDKAPNFYELRKESWPSLTLNDGNIYTFSASNSSMLTNAMLSYRKDWLDKLGYEIPTTLDEYIEVARAFTFDDPDGDDVDNTFAMGKNFDHIFSAYGVLNNSWMEYEGELIYGSVHPNTREALRTLNQLFNMKVIDPEYLTDSSTRAKEKLVSGVYGACMLQTQMYDKQNLNDYYAPFKANNPDGEWVYGPVLQGPGYREDIGFYKIGQRGWLWTAVSANTKNVDAVFRVLDFLSTDEGIMLTNYGIENEHYTYADGVVTPIVSGDQQKELGITDCVLVFEYVFKETSIEFQNARDFANSVGTSDAAVGILLPEIDKYMPDLKPYLESQISRIIVGEVDVDEGFDEMLAEWKSRGGDEVTAAINEAYKARQN